MESETKTTVVDTNSVKEPRYEYKKYSDSGLWPIVLVVIGTYFLLRNFGILNDRLLAALRDAWPLLLVWLGIHLGTRNNTLLRTIGTVAVISILVFILLQNTGVAIPKLR